MSTKTTQTDLSTLSKPRKSFWREMKEPEVLVFVLPYVAFALLAYFMPRTILTDWPEARAFTDVMATIIPMIEVATERGEKFSEVNRFVYSIIWAIAPVYMVLYERYGFKREWCSAMELKSYSELYLKIMGSGAMALLLIVFPGAGTPRLNHMLFSSEFMRALITPGFSFVVALTLLAVLDTLCALIKGRVRIKGEPK